MSATVRRSRRSALLPRLAVALVAAVALSACGSSGSATSESDSADAGGSATSGTARDTIVVVTPDQASNLVRDFGYTAGSDNQEVTNSLHAQLIRKPYIDEEGANVQVQDLYSFEPFLAESYEVSDDGLVYTFKLKEGVLSQQGNELTTDDVIWSFQRKLDTPGGGMAGLFAPMITDVDEQFAKVDDHTFTITIDQAGYGFTMLGNLAENVGSIYDSTYLQANATPDDPYAVDWGVEDMMRSNFGFGAYMIDSVTKEQEIVMVANPNFVDGEPAIKTIIRRTVPEAATRANMLAAGDADVAMELRPSDQAELASNPDVFTPVASSNLYQSVTLNNKMAPFDDVLVRQALAYAIDYNAIVDDIFVGRAYLYTHMLDDQAENYDGSGLPPYSYDPEKAKALLAEAGYPDGVSFTLSVSSALAAMQDSAVVMAAAAKEAGFDIEISQLPAAQMFNDGLEGKLQASMSTGSAVTMSPPYQLSLITLPGSGTNQQFWEGPTYDAFAATMAEGQEQLDAIGPEAYAKWNEAEVMMAENAGVLFVSRIMSPYSLRSDVTGYTQRTDRRIDYSVMSAGS